MITLKHGLQAVDTACIVIPCDVADLKMGDIVQCCPPGRPTGTKGRVVSLQRKRLHEVQEHVWQLAYGRTGQEMCGLLNLKYGTDYSTEYFIVVIKKQI